MDLNKEIIDKILPNLNADIPYSVIDNQLLKQLEPDDFIKVLEIICDKSQQNPIQEGEEQQRVKEIVDSYFNETKVIPEIPTRQQQLKEKKGIEETEFKILQANKEFLEAEKRALEAEKKNYELQKKLSKLSFLPNIKIFLSIILGGFVVLFTLLLREYIYENVIPTSKSNIEQLNSTPLLTADKETTFNDVKNVPRGKIFTYYASRSWGSASRILDPSINSFRNNEIEIKADLIGSEAAVDKLIKDKDVHFIVVSNLVSSERIEKAKKNHGFQFVQKPIAFDGVALVVNERLKNISKLTKEQIKDIYIGKITNWKELGGSDAQIVPISPNPETSGTATWFQEEILDGEEFSKSVKFVQENTEAIEELKETSYGLFYATVSQTVTKCKIKPLKIENKKIGEFVAPYKGNLTDNCPDERNEINVEAFAEKKYPFTRQFYVVIKMDGGEDEKIGRAYANLVLTDQGKDLLENIGLIRLNSKGRRNSPLKE